MVFGARGAAKQLTMTRASDLESTIECTMRVVTWNINGVRTLPQYHPWNTLKSHDDILNYLNADIICFQEVKSSRQALLKPVAVPPSYDSFFSFPVRKTGYSGVAIYTRRSTLVPNKAEEGLTGLIQPKPPLTTEERISADGSYPSDSTLNLVDDLSDEEQLDFKDLDSEGRALVLDVGLFVLINVYCPNTGTGTDEREKFKRNYHKLLKARVDALIKEGREVMVVGDLNACAAIQDHCEGSLLVARGLAKGLQGEEGFWGVNCRGYVRNWLVDAEGSGCMVDIVRRFWPTRKGMYTCWNTKISARESNYGTRIDFILVTPNLIPWIAAADIQPEIKGSDHCPVFVDFRDEIVDAGITIKLQDVLGVQAIPGAAKEPPRLAAKFWDEYSAKQTLLENFFGRQPVDTHTLDQSSTAILVSDNSIAAEPLESGQSSPSLPSSKSHDLSDSLSPSSSTTAPASPTSKRKIAETGKSSKRLKLIPTLKNKITKPKEKNPSQSTIASFFSQPKATKSASSSTTSASKRKDKVIDTQPLVDDDIKSPHGPTQDADYRLALILSSQDSISSSSQGHPERETKQAWNDLLAPIQPPNCIIHREPAKELIVNKQGPNKGKRFFICSRPVGPGYDKGRSERLREQVDHQWRCDFFKWSSDVRKERMKKGDT